MPYEKISRKTDFIIKKLTYLLENKPSDLAEFKTYETTQMAILYAIHTAIEALIDIVIIIETKQNGNKYIGDYEKFTALFENGFINEDVYDGLRRLNGLRNAVVHAYDSLTIDEIYDNYEKIIHDIATITESLCEKYDHSPDL